MASNAAAKGDLTGGECAATGVADAVVADELFAEGFRFSLAPLRLPVGLVSITAWLGTLSGKWRSLRMLDQRLLQTNPTSFCPRNASPLAARGGVNLGNWRFSTTPFTAPLLAALLR